MVLKELRLFDLVEWELHWYFQVVALSWGVGMHGVVCCSYR